MLTTGTPFFGRSTGPADDERARATGATKTNRTAFAVLLAVSVRGLGLAVVMLLVVVAVGPADATVPTDLDFVVETSLAGDPSPFQASGPAVDEGLVCPKGTVVDAAGRTTGFSPTGFNAHWNIHNGNGDYERLHGAGSGVGIGGEPCGDPNLCVLDLYYGRIHID